MSEQILTEMYAEILKNHFPKKGYQINAVFYKTRSIRHTIELKSRVIQIRIAGQFITAPERILYILGIILFSKLFRYKLTREWRKEYNQYVDKFILPGIRSNVRKPSDKYTASGKYFNLDQVFDEVNQSYFGGSLTKPVLGWSLNKSYVRLGFYAGEKNLLVISKIFDSKKTPPAIVYYLMYHEMLHIYIPTKQANGRRSIHPPEFKKMEREFPDFDEIQKWINRNRHKL